MKNKTVFNPQSLMFEQVRGLVSTVYNLSGYEERLLSALLCADKPLCAYELMDIGVPRTKIYSLCKRMGKSGLVETRGIDPALWRSRMCGSGGLSISGIITYPLKAALLSVSPLGVMPWGSGCASSLSVRRVSRIRGIVW